MPWLNVLVHVEADQVNPKLSCQVWVVNPQNPPVHRAVSIELSEEKTVTLQSQGAAEPLWRSNFWH